MTRTTAIIRDERATYDEMAIVKKYEEFLFYFYPKIQNCPRKHGVLRDAVLEHILAVVPALHLAGRSNQISRLREVDALLATIRFDLRLLVEQLGRDPKPALTPHQSAEALRRLNEVGKMLGAWMGKVRG